MTGTSAREEERCLHLIVGADTVFIQLADNLNYSRLIGSYPLAGRQSLRMREAANKLYLEAKNDAGVWFELGSAPTPFSADFMDMSIAIGAGTCNPQPTASTVIWDNLNTP